MQMNSLLQSLLKLIKEEIPSEVVSLFYQEKEGRISIWDSCPEGFGLYRHSIQFVRKAMNEKLLVFSGHDSSDRRAFWKRTSLKEGTGYIFCLPIILESRVLGVLFLWLHQ